MKIWHISSVFALILACSGCGTARLPHLESRVVNALHQDSVAVIYTDPVQSLTVLRYGGRGMNAYGGGAIGALVDSGVNAAGDNHLEDKLKAYSALLDKQDVIDRNYDATRKALLSISWLQKATWRRIHNSQSDNPRTFELAQQSGKEIVIFIHPQTMIYGDGDPLDIRCWVSIYAADPAGSRHYEHIETHMMDAVAPIGPDGSDSLPNPQFYNQYLKKGAELDQQLAAVFANDGALFGQAYSESLSKLKEDLVFFFTGEKSVTK